MTRVYFSTSFFSCLGVRTQNFRVSCGVMTMKMMAFNDLDYAVRIVASHAKASPEGRLVTIEFDRCQGAPAPSVADLSCEIESCAASTGAATGCRCQILALQ